VLQGVAAIRDRDAHQLPVALVVQRLAVVAPDRPESCADVDWLALPVKGLHEDFRARRQKLHVREPAAVPRDARVVHRIGVAWHQRSRLFVAGGGVQAASCVGGCGRIVAGATRRARLPRAERQSRPVSGRDSGVISGSGVVPG
jgi:hypothetical protein